MPTWASLRLSLRSTSVSSVLLVAGASLFSTVSLRSFLAYARPRFIPSGKEKTLLLFVIRDHVGSTPMSNLTATLTQDMERIWHSLAKAGPLSSRGLV